MKAAYAQTHKDSQSDHGLLVTKEDQKLEALLESLDETCTRYKMEICAEKTKLATSSANKIQERSKKGAKAG